jgi:hypothetical protein
VNCTSSLATLASKWPAKQGPFPFLWRTAFTSTAATVRHLFGPFHPQLESPPCARSPEAVPTCCYMRNWRRWTSESFGHALVVPRGELPLLAGHLWLALAFIPRSENPESRSVDATPHWPLFEAVRMTSAQRDTQHSRLQARITSAIPVAPSLRLHNVRHCAVSSATRVVWTWRDLPPPAHEPLTTFDTRQHELF